MGRHLKNAVALTNEERELLTKQTKSGSWGARGVTRAKILLLIDLNGDNPLDDEKTAQEVGCSISAVRYRRRRFATTGSVEDTIFDRPRSGRPSIVDAAIDAHMTAIACSTPPDGRAKWTLRLIKDRLVQLEVVDEISHTTVGRSLKKKQSSHG
jgi:putative transposase